MKDTVRLTAWSIVLELADGREYRIPRDYTRKLSDANIEQLRKYKFIGSPPVGICWPELDEDLSIGALGAYLRT